MPRIIAIDWSGAQHGAHRKIWLAEVIDGDLIRLECGRTREDLTQYLIGEAVRDSQLVIGFDFAFSLPAWFLSQRALPNAPALWELVAREGEDWLSRCDPPFWGRPGRRRPDLPNHWRRTDLEVPDTNGVRPKSVFQIGGGGAVGTGSLRGMPILKQLWDAGFAIWPFTNVWAPLVIEIYPRLLTGAVNKQNAAARHSYLRNRFGFLSPEMLDLAASTEDAFDAAVSALVMESCQHQFAELPTSREAEWNLEGRIWEPGLTRV